MPRIDPLQLLTCLSVLLSPDGGILSRDEVPRLVNLMTKFSKKLVSKCVYVLILKNTETSLVDMFMAEGGWTLIQNWLQDGAQTGNWGLVKEILGLMLVTPVDVDRLKTNSLPKLIKNLSRREDLGEVAQISNQIVQKWLSIVKGTTNNTAATVNGVPAQPQADTRVDAELISSEKKSPENDIQSENKDMVDGEDDNSGNSDEGINTSTFYKVSVKDGKQIIRKLSVESDKDSSGKSEDDKAKESDKDKSKSKSSSSSKSTSSSKSSSSSSKERDKDKKKSSSSSSSSKSKSSSSSKDKDRKDRERDRKDKSKHSSSKSSSKSSDKDKKDKSKSSSSSSSSSDSKSSKDKRSDNDKETLDKLKTNSLDKLGRIPKKSSASSDVKEKENKSSTEEKKKPSFSILNRKSTGEERTKTVKVFNSKMRSTGLEEEAKPPPPRSSTKKPTPSVQLPTIPQKRPSPPREPTSSMPPEKKLKIDRVDIPDRPGAIKLIPPKPKPAVLQESDMFMDALTAAAPKKETKKRKRRLSATKEVGQSPTTESVPNDAPVQQSPSSPTGLGLKSIAPINFYQDTLSQENGDDKSSEGKEAVENEADGADTPASPATPTDTENAMEGDETPTRTRVNGGLRGVLLFSKKRGPKRSIKWKSDDDLVEVRYFELDETERVNVTKTFIDMARMELNSEREALIMSRKLPNEDVMEAQMLWRPLIICDQPESLVVPGSKSLEKDIQFAREKASVAAFYFDKRRIPDSPEEPIPETHQISDPVQIPLDDAEGHEIDLRQTPWPEPKTTPPQIEPQIPPVYPNMPFNGNFNNIPTVPFMGVPNRFPGPPGPHGPVPPGPGNFGPPNMMPNNMMGPPMNQPDMMNPGMPMNPGMFGPGPDGFMPHVNNEPNFPMQPFNGPQGPNMNMYGPNNFNHRGGRGGFRRGGNNNGGWVQLNPGPRPWQRGGGGGRGGRLCKNKQNHGYCRNEPNCPFIH